MLQTQLISTESDYERRKAGSAENPPRHSLLMTWTLGWLSVTTHVQFFDWMMTGLKFLTEAAILSASTSHGNHVPWCLRSFVL